MPLIERDAWLRHKRFLARSKKSRVAASQTKRDDTRLRAFDITIAYVRRDLFGLRRTCQMVYSNGSNWPESQRAFVSAASTQRVW